VVVNDSICRIHNITFLWILPMFAAAAAAVALAVP
jgi:hypothetical protein